MRLAVVATHPVQYYGPLYAALARRCDLTVLYAMVPDAAAQGAAFGTAFEWDVDARAGHHSEVLDNVSARPDPSRMRGCDTPGVGARLSAGRFDAALVMGWYAKTHLQALWACRRLGVPVLVRSDSQAAPAPHWRRAAKALAYPALLRAFDGALHVGSRSRAYLRGYGYPEARLFHAPHAVDTARFAAGATPGAAAEVRRAAGIGPGGRIALFAGKLAPAKRPLDAVGAAARLRAAGVPLTVMVAGAGPLEGRMRARAAALDVPLAMLGFVNQSRMPAVHAAADLLVLPSERETWGLVVNEALACGTPALVSRAAGCAPDLATPHGPVRGHPPGDVPALARAMGRMLDDPPAPEAVRALSDRLTPGRAADAILGAARAAARARAGAAGAPSRAPAAP